MLNESVSDTVFSVVHAYRMAMRLSLKANDLGINSMHVRCLSFIHHVNVCTANDIVQQFARDKAQIARLLKEMIGKGWLTKTANPDDKRSQLLSLTPEGLVLAKRIDATQHAIHQKMQENLTDGELQEFIRIAGIMSSNLRC